MLMYWQLYAFLQVTISSIKWNYEVPKKALARFIDNAEIMKYEAVAHVQHLSDPSRSEELDSDKLTETLKS